MTLEEKIANLRIASMKEARAEGNAIIDNYREALQKVLEDHKEEAVRQSETRVKAETISAKQQLNQEQARSQLELKRIQGKLQQDLKDKVFEEVSALIQDFMKTDAYKDYLLKCIKKAAAFAGNDSMVIYINPSDKDLLAELEETCGVKLTISEEDFTGGIRTVIRSRNILIDDSFKTSLQNEYDKFFFLGGGGIA
ncbi:MAG: V-type ATP synthase subunit E [Muricomes sp.]